MRHRLASPLAAAVFVLATLLLSRSSPSQTAASHPSPPRTVLVELFTSEGCSSCPPADTLLQQLDGQRVGSGELVVGLSEHVTYWNHLGWTDPFSSAALTDRQSAYSDRFGLGSVYTPEIVIDGEQEVVGSDRPAVLQAIRKAGSAAPSSVTLQILSASIAANTLSINFSVKGTAPVTGADVFAAIADDRRSSHVGRGENADRTLIHTAVARSLVRLSALQTGDALTAHIPVPPGDNTACPQHLVLFVQTRGLGRVLAADSKPLVERGSSSAPTPAMALH